MNDRYADQVVLITGGAQGLGRAMVERFASEGAEVHIADVNRYVGEELAASLAGRVRVRPTAHVLDVTDEGGVAALVNTIAEQSGRLDALVNNAGIIRDNRIENISADDWHAVIDVSLTGAFHCVKAVMPHMRAANYGRIVSFSSMSWRGNFGQANYVAAKAGVVGLTRAIALESAHRGITANAIAPGLIETPMLTSMNGPARDKLTAKIPLDE